MTDFKELIAKRVLCHSGFLNHNHKALEIYEGELHKYVQEVMQKTLSKSYFDTIKERLIPINVLQKVIDKCAKVYAYPVVRTSEKYQDFIDRMVEMLDLDGKMLNAEEYSFLHKGYAIEPYLSDDLKPKLRVLPYDRFLPFSENKKDRTEMTGMIKLMGSVSINGKDCELYHEWDKFSFKAYTSEGIYNPDMIDASGNPIVNNPMGFVPFVYGNRSKSRLVPIADSDMLKLTQVIPIILSDMGGAIMYQCFTIIFGIDVKTANLTMSPNAFWDLKSDPKSEKTPSVGTINPSADVNKVLNFVNNIFSLWLESKGIKVGNVGSINGSNFGSGISKIIDNMDTTEIRKKSMKYLVREEKELWILLAKMHNYWLQSVPEYTGELIDLESFDVSIKYTEPTPETQRSEIVDTVLKEYQSGFMTAGDVIDKLYPDLTPDEYKARVAHLEAHGKK
jgi:hypothetical protein